ncbi:unnamed protein product [Ciceribacter selenitireducens ATCC BAA-1503]|uniref:DUF3768 domain-containing protein n=1 Tax=Ciceribacter selenitireducens ATCC BAA-1503 TaxID=1336235 RepID=A0A376ADE8_9HYPH|nr:unnamed protein product [Ciceribacter selenitireducens ATCC BAA-1503]
MAAHAETLTTNTALNDLFRLDFSRGRVVMTPGVAALPQRALCDLLRAVQNFDAFTPDNDPHSEHDFGKVAIGGETYLWKIDYYDAHLEHSSPNPADPAVTTRVMTIMRGDEY